MNKKTGIILASVIGVLVLCCGGVFYLTRSTLERVKETIQQNRDFVATTLDKTGKSWDEAVFSEVADSAFLTPEGRDGTKKRFAIFNKKLGKLKSLGIAGTKRIAALPDTPTFAEQGFPGIENNWYGLFTTAGTPPAVVEAIYKDIAEVIARPDFQAKLVDLGALPGGDTPAAFSARFQRDIKEAGTAIARLGMKAE